MQRIFVPWPNRAGPECSVLIGCGIQIVQPFANRIGYGGCVGCGVALGCFSRLIRGRKLYCQIRFTVLAVAPTCRLQTYRCIAIREAWPD